MPISFSRSVRTVALLSAVIAAPSLAISAGSVSAAETIKAQLATAPNVPPPITRTQPATVVVNLEANEWVGPLSDDNNYEFWGFNKSVPGPMIRVMVGDTVEIRLKNHKDSKEAHNIDFHAITGPGGGASLLNSEPGQESGGKFKMIIPGIFLYHCATASPSIPEHIANGMYGTIVVEPVGGLKPVDKEFQIMQSEFYTKDGEKGETLEFSFENGLDERPSHVVYNGNASSLVKKPLRAKAGDTVRIFLTNAGPNFVDSLQILEQPFDRVYPEGSLTSPPAENVKVTRIPAGGAVMAEFKVKAGTYTIVDPVKDRKDKGALGLLKVD
ncbi:MAG: nitrite reductase, copper-containing [Nitrospira sp.]|nr:multicopper oxidase domain-containing protein [Nitrospira sp.]TKB75974.1 MAG: nitrite reductase, copper-containing [Nitrospira sp.]